MTLAGVSRPHPHVGAAGRDFHNFNVVYRDDTRYEVVGFTAAQIPNIADRRYPPDLAGPLYPEGVPIFDEADLASLVERLEVRQVVFSYSDVSYGYVMHRARSPPRPGPTSCCSDHARR